MADKRKRNTRVVTLGDAEIQPGQRRSVELPVTDLYTHTGMSMPVEVINGRLDGPTLFVCAAIHGDEINGVEIVRRLLASKSLSRLRGTLIAIPIVNVLGFLNLSRYLPDRRDLNRSFPGSQRGSAASRLAYIFCEQIVRQADFGIDLHTAAVHRANLPQIRAQLNNPVTRELADAFAAPVIVDASQREGSLRSFAISRDMPLLVYEAGEALRFDEMSIRAGVRGVLRVMRKIGMLPGKPPAPFGDPVIARDSAWVRAPQSGIVVYRAKLGARVKKDEVVATLSDPFGNNLYDVSSPHHGIVIGSAQLPLAHEGDALCHIAEFEAPVAAERTVAAFQAHQRNNPVG
ncbi:MAG: succinylglutamate desuccinylase/aspartoacylase family protein [Pseudomonadota bacterium]